jgi:uncharacterized protein YbjT (DUF2867 family)
MTPSPATSVLVFGITGNQGSSVATSLLDAGVKVVGLSRNPEGAKAKGESESVFELFAFQAWAS